MRSSETTTKHLVLIYNVVLVTDKAFEERVSQRCERIRGGMRDLARKLEDGDESELVYWISRRDFGCTVRPLRRHPRYGGSRAKLPADTRQLIDSWIEFLKVENIRSILSLMHDEDLACYSALGLENDNLLDHLSKAAFEVARCPYEDPHHKTSSAQEKRQTLLSVRTRAFTLFKTLPNPVLIMCSSGIDRSAPVAAFIVESEAEVDR